MAEAKQSNMGPVRDVRVGAAVNTGKGMVYPRDPFEHGRKGQRVLVDVDPDGRKTPGRIYLGVPTADGKAYMWSFISESACDGVRYWAPGDENRSNSELAGSNSPVMPHEIRNQLIKWGELDAKAVDHDPYDRRPTVIPANPMPGTANTRQ